MILHPPAEPDDLWFPEEEEDRFRGLVPQAVALGAVTASLNPATFTVQDMEDIEARLVDLARVDPSCFIRYVFEWPMQQCHIEWQDFLSDHDRAIIWAPIEHGKSSQISVARPLFELGQNPNLRIKLISNTEAQSAKSLSVIKAQIELNPRLNRVFPLLRRETRAGRQQKWHDTAIVVRRDDLDNKDSSAQAVGLSTSILGDRVDLAVLDDVLDRDNTRTPSARENVLGIFDSTIAGRLSAFGKIWAIGNAWHREDLMHTLAKRSAWKSRRYDGRQEGLWPELVSIGGKLCGWPQRRLDRKREEIPALEFDRQFGNLALSEDAITFDTQSIIQCFDGVPWDPPPHPSWQTYVGVDLSVDKKDASDNTSFFIGRLEAGRKVVLRIIAKKMNLADILYYFLWIEARYHPVLFLVENNAAQDYIRQWFLPDTITRTLEARGEDPAPYLAKLPRVQGFHTGKNKADPYLGISGMTLEFAQKRWSIPDHELTRAWKDEMVDFNPHAHTGDILMSSWFFHSAALKFRPRRIRSSSISSAQ